MEVKGKEFRKENKEGKIGGMKSKEKKEKHENIRGKGKKTG